MISDTVFAVREEGRVHVVIEYIFNSKALFYSSCLARGEKSVPDDYFFFFGGFRFGII